MSSGSGRARSGPPAGRAARQGPPSVPEPSRRAAAAPRPRGRAARGHPRRAGSPPGPDDSPAPTSTCSSDDLHLPSAVVHDETVTLTDGTAPESLAPALGSSPLDEGPTPGAPGSRRPPGRVVVADVAIPLAFQHDGLAE